MKMRWTLDLELTDGEAEAMYAGELPSPVPLAVIGGLLRCRDELNEEFFYVVYRDEDTGEEWEAKIVADTPDSGWVYRLRRC